jgi:hypothetical protein
VQLGGKPFMPGPHPTPCKALMLMKARTTCQPKAHFLVCIWASELDCRYPRRKYLDSFMEAAEVQTKSDGPVEYTLEHMEIYRKYLEVFEKKVAGAYAWLLPSGGCSCLSPSPARLMFGLLRLMLCCHEFLGSAW